MKNIHGIDFFSSQEKIHFHFFSLFFFCHGGLSSSFYHKTGDKFHSIWVSDSWKKNFLGFLSGSHMRAVPGGEIFIYTCASKWSHFLHSTSRIYFILHTIL